MKKAILLAVKVEHMSDICLHYVFIIPYNSFVSLVSGFAGELLAVQEESEAEESGFLRS